MLEDARLGRYLGQHLDPVILMLHLSLSLRTSLEEMEETLVQVEMVGLAPSQVYRQEAMEVMEGQGILAGQVETLVGPAAIQVGQAGIQVDR